VILPADHEGFFKFFLHHLLKPQLFADSDEGDRGSGLMVISIPGSM
jgi:hypothetical protein